MALYNNTTTPATSTGIKPLWGTLILPKTGELWLYFAKYYG